MFCCSTSFSEILAYKTTPIHRKKEPLANMSMKMKLFNFENCSEDTTNDGVIAKCTLLELVNQSSF